MSQTIISIQIRTALWYIFEQSQKILTVNQSSPYSPKILSIMTLNNIEK
uniref:Uncharacterized protein n=1 Tax=Anguilla anguilla TaxID=7936 RepID=A0A0E9WPX0_ANGAN